MKKLKQILLITSFLATTAQAQVIRSVSDFNAFSTHSSEFNAPLQLEGNETSVTWKERTTSFGSSRGIRTFVAYAGNKLVGTLSLNGTQAYGELAMNGNTYMLSTDANGRFTATRQDEDKHCAACNCSIGDLDGHGLKHEAHSRYIGNARSAPTGGNKPIISNTGILRQYRLALLVDYWAYPDNKEGAETFMASVEAFANELYYRDFGICFEVVRNDNLIRHTKDRAVYAEASRGIDILAYSAGKFAEIIPATDYDLGFVVHPLRYDTDGGVGYAYMDYAYKTSGRTQGVATMSARTVAHELGHMFGAEHTYVGSESDSYQTELGTGQSLMGTERATPRNFFSLVTLQDMRSNMAKNNLYYTDESRSTVVLPDGTEKPATELTTAEKAVNIVNGVNTHNQAPVIDTTRLKRTYIVPPGAYLQFHIPANDADGDELTYTAQQADIGNGNAARFRTLQGVKDSCVMIRKDYQQGEMLQYSDHTTEEGKSYTFWLSASDPKPYSADAFKNNPHATAYDVYETKVQVKGTSKFAVNRYEPNIVSTCYEGYKVTINWTADPDVFDEDSRFRVLFSKNGGATYESIIKEDIRALDNSCDIYIPYGIGTGYYADRNGKQVYKCLLKLEHVDGVAFTEFPVTSTTTGFYISSGTRVTFDGLPSERYVETTRDNLPSVPKVTAKNNGGAEVKFTETESKDGKFIFRTWETTSYSKTYGFEQIIKIIGETPTEDEEKLKALIQEAEELHDIAQATDDNSVGYYTKESVSKLSNAISNAKNETTSAQEAYNALQKAIDDMELIMPEEGKFYVISGTRSGDKVFVNNDGGLQFENNTTTAAHVFRFVPSEGNSFLLYSVSRGTYLNSANNGGQQTATASTTTEAKAISIENVGYKNYVSLTPHGGEMLHAQTEGSMVVGKDSEASSWIVSETDIAEVSHTLAIGDSGWATLYLPFNAVVPENVSLYTVYNHTTDRAMLEKFDGKILPKYTPVLVNAAPASTTEFRYSSEEVYTVANNELRGTTLDKNITDNAYVLSYKDNKVGFYKASLIQDTFKNNAFKAYLPVDPDVFDKARFIFFDFGTETAIEGIRGSENTAKDVIYDLTGRRVNGENKGLYIKNGKKVVY